VLLGLLLVAVVALPLTIKDDGTLVSRVQVLLRYTLGAVTIILSVSTLWAGCAAVATEVQDRQIQLIVTKPVRPCELWLGKWLGLMTLNALLLAVAGGVTYGLMSWNLRSERGNPQLQEEILVARRAVCPESVPVTDQARQAFAAQKVSDETIREFLRQRAHTVPPGMATRLTFRLPKWPSAGRPLILRYKFASSLTDKNPVACVFVAGAVDRADRWYRQEYTAPGGLHSVAIPSAMVAADGTLTLEIANINPLPLTMVFDPNGGLELLIYEGGFAGNFIRALAVVWCGLGFLAALGVTLGSLFSLPVAALGAGYGVLLTNIGSYLQHLTGQESWLRGMYVVMYWVSKPFQMPDPLEKLATGELVGWWWLGSVLLWQVMVCGGALATVGAWLFGRRELGAAE
jgi:hypothetical protein